MRDIKLTLRAVDDLLSRDNFELIKEFLDNIPFSHFKGKHVEYSVSAAGTWNVPHHLGFAPLDVITTFNTAGSLTWNYASFSKTHIDFTTTSAGTVRAFIGTYKEM
jgi:hypothetical protein